MIESETSARFAASTDETGNVEQGGNWDLELGGRSVAPLYFHPEMLGEFTKVMCPEKKKKGPEAVVHNARKVHAQGTAHNGAAENNHFGKMSDLNALAEME